MTEAGRIALAARVFTLATVGSLCVVRGIGFQGLGLILVVAVAAESIQLSTSWPPARIAVLEGALVAGAVVAAFPANDATFPYLAIPALVAGLHRGMRWSLLVIAVEAVALVAVSSIWIESYSPRMTASGVTWLITGLGLGYLGSVVHKNLASSGEDASYRDALELIKQLHALSGKLESGLDPVSIAEQLMDQVAAQVETRQSVVMLRMGDGSYSPLRYSDGAQPGTFGDVDRLLEECWHSRTSVTHGSRLALPLAADSQMVAVLLTEGNTLVEPRHGQALSDTLRSESVRLHAALLFTDVRESATSDERQRLAREVHDGVAQDVASLGYLVDNLVDSATTEHHAREFDALRTEISRVVKELRNSVFDLRNEVGAGQGLGQSIASFARHIGSHSDLTVHVTLDEAGPRLRPQVEAELLRIAQEAINNARRHSGAENLWVTVEVQPPRARIVVLDDGAGVQGRRSDSHGLRIMRERAERVDADLRVVSPAQDGRGTRLEVHLAAAAESGTTKSTGGQAPAPHQGDEHADSPRRR